MIERLDAWQVFDSRGTPSICVMLSSGNAQAQALVPSGASTGQYEALELRDGGRAFAGKGIKKALGHVTGVIASCVVGMPLDPQAIDQALIKLDGTVDKSRLGANAILAVSMAAWRLCAIAQGVPLYAVFSQQLANPLRLPIPMVNVINGGVHASNALNIQEFMLVPHGFADFASAISAASEVSIRLREELRRRGWSLLVGDEGGFSVELSDARAVIELLLQLIADAGFAKSIGVSLDIAANEFYIPGQQAYQLEPGKEALDVARWVDLLANWCAEYDLFSVEDPFADDDPEAWAAFDKVCPASTLVVGDDLFVTQSARLQQGIDQNLASAILIKPNQVGTVSETIDCINLAKTANWPFIVSHRSGDTEDSWIADFAVAMQAPLIKTGAICRSERVSKYNRLLAIQALCAEKSALAVL